MSYVLRPVQTDFIAGISASFRQHRRVLGVAPTGFGKTLVFCDITRRTHERNKRVYIVAHRIEIIRQIANALFRAGVRYGWIAAGRPSTNDMVQIGMVQTVANRIRLLPKPDLLVIDEAHHATAGSYRKLTEAWPDVFVLGVTASPQRTDGTGLGECFDAMVVGPSMRELIARGYLANFSYLAPPQQVDLTGVKTRAGDYASDQLAAAMDQRNVTGDAIAHYAKHLAGQPAIAFCVSVDHAKHVAEQFRQAGWNAESVDGATDDAVRADRIAAIGDGRLNVLTSCDIISEGTDIPAVAGALLLRPTQSLIIFLQQVGRVLRPKQDGSRAVILDHVGNVFRHGMPDEERAWSLEGKPKRSAAIAVRQCPKCYAAFAPAPKCPNCDHVLVTDKPTRSAITQREGELAEVDAKQVAAERARELKRLLAAAHSLPDAQARIAFQSIARNFNYKPGWVFMQMQLRRGRRNAA
jgi:superfamily II DNA or RNA helicase